MFCQQLFFIQEVQRKKNFFEEGEKKVRLGPFKPTRAVDRKHMFIEGWPNP